MTQFYTLRNSLINFEFEEINDQGKYEFTFKK